MRRNEVGKWGATYRIENDILLQEMAEKLKVSSSYLSSVEHGRKPIPDDWHVRVTEALELSLPEGASLLVATMRARKRVTIPIETNYEARVMVAFEESRSRLDETLASQIEAIIRSNDGGQENERKTSERTDHQS